MFYNQYISFQDPKHCFPMPYKQKQRNQLFPLFIPFSGCPVRCVFCSQEVQTGQKNASIKTILEKTRQNFAQMQTQNTKPLELAFYGGTFTALTKTDFALCLDFAKEWQDKGLITKVRCSTRPDALNDEKITALQSANFSTIELGVQSFADQALEASKRNYSGATALQACKLVQQAGFDLGIQLLLGMPGVTPQVAKDDLEQSLALRCNFLRLYPCLVFRGTELEKSWSSGLYLPWSADETIKYLASACKRSWQADIPIIRMGLAPEQGLLENVRAGFFHPALGNMAKSLALAMYIEEELCRASKQSPKLEYLLETYGQSVFTDKALEQKYFVPAPAPLHILVPQSLQGDFWGHGASLKPFYASLGIFPTSTQFVQSTMFTISPQNSSIEL